jgi:hypothetical protein
MKTTLILLTMSLCACSSMTKETYTETRHFHYPKGTTPHIKEMYMHKQPEVMQAEPVIHQQFNQPDPVDFTYIGELPEERTRTLAEVREENDLLSALRANKILKQMQ